MLANIQRKMFTADEYHTMAEAGILKEDDHLELIKGDIYMAAAIGSQHAACVKGMTIIPGCFPEVEIPVDEIIGQWE